MTEGDLPELPLYTTSLKISGRIETLRNGTFSGLLGLKELDMSESRHDGLFTTTVYSRAGLASFVAYHRLDIVYCWHLRRQSRFRKSYVRCNKNQAHYENDAFVAYAGSSEEWIVRQFLPHVEGEGQSTDQGQGKGQDISFKVCIHSRDFLPGEYIIDNIVEKMEASRATILIISHNFIKSDWCKYEVDITQAKVLRERRGAIIVVFLEQIPYKQLPKTLRLMKRHLTYLEWLEEENEHKRAEFWKKIKLSLLKRIQQTNRSSDDNDTQV
ncbi:toll-like receptor 2 [Lingula anatina]|uniref:Toll-like receptor 2 n=1 Tax=Lingula anatina TaxID=7574 RepID=A0A2R2MM47_LINAN|nr:toll-like receptor 2 [Lingula anatina]|eukprot:XP_023931132.1 toll-like receptor 2 [Lingula anatina]